MPIDVARERPERIGQVEPNRKTCRIGGQRENMELFIRAEVNFLVVVRFSLRQRTRGIHDHFFTQSAGLPHILIPHVTICVIATIGP